MKNLFVILFACGLILGPIVFQNCAAIDFDGNAGNNTNVNQANTAAGTLTGATCVNNKITCPDLPPNCTYGGQQVDANGCFESCGTVECEGPVQCPLVVCEEPPAGCVYEGDPLVDGDGCPVNCGNLKCDNEEPIICPDFMCAAPPPGCRYQGNDDRDANGCPVNCGDLVCDSETPPACPAIACAPLGEGCSYTKDPSYDENGCLENCGEFTCAPTPPIDCPVNLCVDPGPGCRYKHGPVKPGECPGCGKIVCDQPPKPPGQCPQIACALLKHGCFYKKKPSYDRNGCLNNCGETVCFGKPSQCIPSRQCDPIACKPAPGCHYDGKPHFNRNGCPTDCGTLKCDNDKPKFPFPPQPPGKNCPDINYLCAAPTGCYYDGKQRKDKNGCEVGCGNLICKK